MNSEHRSRRPSRLALTGLVAVLLVGVAVMVWSQLRDREGPEEVVQGYLDALAAKDLATADRIVAPGDWSGWSGDGGDPGPLPGSTSDHQSVTLDPQGIRTSYLATSTVAISDPQTFVAGSRREAAEVGDRLAVSVTYSIGQRELRTELRAERLLDTWYGFTRWRVVDPLLVPTRVVAALPSVPGTTLGGVPISLSAPVAASGAAPDHLVLLHPGSYELAAPQGRYLITATPTSQQVLAATLTSEPTVLTVSFLATEALQRSADDALAPDVRRCIDALPDGASDCGEPFTFLDQRTDVTDVVVERLPRLEEPVAYQTTWTDGTAPTPLRSNSSIGRLNYRVDGEQVSESFYRCAWYVVTDVDTVAVEFHDSLSG